MNFHITPPSLLKRILLGFVLDIHGYGTIFLDRIRERNWFRLVYDNEDGVAYYCPKLVTQFFTQIDTNTIDLDQQTFIVHFETGDIIVNINTLWIVTHIPCLPQHDTPFPIIEYMTAMGVRCEEKDHGLKANTTFQNVHCVGRWVQCNILGLYHTITFNRPVLQIMHSLMTRAALSMSKHCHIATHAYQLPVH